MEKFFKKDSFWEFYGITNENDFITQISLENKYHDNLPKDIVEGFETVIQLLNLSYFHSNLLDEAVTKALVTIETGIKIKAKELGIELKELSKKKGIIKEKRLFRLIEEVLKVTGQEHLKPDFDRARSMRNRRLHIDSHFFNGLLGYPRRNIKSFINLMNQIFLPVDKINEINELQSVLDKNVEEMKDDLYILEFNKKKVLIDEVYKIQYITDGKVKLLIAFMNPVINNPKEYYNTNQFNKPLVLAIKDFSINDNSIEGLDLKEEKISLFKNEKDSNKITYNEYLKEIKEVSEERLDVHLAVVRQQYPWRFEEIIYENCWNK
ncbi:conserved hypothetical protein [Tenacibaculum litoreum]|uniref:hypothetical protein n=1 Tax=Tenacibaculum litoreum TaxID=321269 RepID=UPI0038941988